MVKNEEGAEDRKVPSCQFQKKKKLSFIRREVERRRHQGKGGERE